LASFLLDIWCPSSVVVCPLAFVLAITVAPRGTNFDGWPSEIHTFDLDAATSAEASLPSWLSAPEDAVSTPARNEPITSAPLAAELSGGAPMLAERICERMRAEIPSYRAVPLAELRGDLSAEVASVARAVRDGHRSVSAEQLADRAAAGERRARQGIPLQDMLKAWMIGLQEAIAWGHETAMRVGATPESASDLGSGAIRISSGSISATRPRH
jgi:hypothetical protein